MSLVARSIAAIDGQSVAALLPAIAEYKHQAQKHQDEVAACLDRIGTSPITWRRRRSHSGPPSLGAMATPALLATTNPSSVLLPRKGKGIMPARPSWQGNLRLTLVTVRSPSFRRPARPTPFASIDQS